MLVIFSILAIFAIASAISTVLSKHPVKSAMSLVVHFFSLAGLYFTLNAQFIAVIQILVYAGAIMVLVVFVIMLLNLGNEKMLNLQYTPRTYLAIALAVSLLVLIVGIVFNANSGYTMNSPEVAQMSSVNNLGNELYTNYLFPFEAISILLLSAIVGAIVLAKRKLS